MPEELCLKLIKSVQNLLGIEDAVLKTHAYLTIEVLFAGRKLFKHEEHVDKLLTFLLKNQEFLTDGRIREQEEMMVVAYI